MSSVIDFGPGEKHIFKRIKDIPFYVPEILHLAPTYDEVVRLFISDIMRSKLISEVYGAIGYDLHTKNYIMISNHPIRRVRVHGRIISCISREQASKMGPSQVFVVRVDDVSGKRSIIDCIVKESTFIASGMSYRSPGYNTVLVEIQGEIRSQFGVRELVGDFMEVVDMGTRETIAKEVDLWRKYLNERDLLKHPWRYSPSNSLVDTQEDDFALVREIEVAEDIGAIGDNNEAYEVVTSNDEDDDVVVEKITLINPKSFDEMICEFLHWMLENNSVKFKLKDLYKDPILNRIIENQALQNPQHPTKAEVFHKIRDHIQNDCNLILVTKSRNVYCSCFFKVVYFVAEELKRCKKECSKGTGRLVLAKTLAGAEQIANGGVSVTREDSYNLKPAYIHEIIRWLTRKEQENWCYDGDSDEWVFTRQQ